MRALIPLLGALMVAAGVSPCIAGDPQWLSDAPPPSDTAGKSRHNHGGVVEEGDDGKMFKRLWLRAGAELPKAGYLHGAPGDAVELTLLDPLGRVTTYSAEALGHGGLRFELAEEGYYNVYLVEQRVQGGALATTVTKAEVLKHSCRDGRHDWAAVAERIPPHALASAPFDIVRVRAADEDFHTEIRSGDNVRFRVEMRGRPVSGAQVRIITQQGWEKTVATGDDGVASFLVIRDYFPRWEMFQRRYREKYLVVADYATEAHGSYRGSAYRAQRFRATLPGSYLPSKRDYTSYAYGLGLVLFASTFSGLGVYLYRRRRSKPYREASLGE
jgi:hypothetical protein